MVKMINFEKEKGSDYQLFMSKCSTYLQSGASSLLWENLQLSVQQVPPEARRGQIWRLSSLNMAIIVSETKLFDS